MIIKNESLKYFMYFKFMYDKRITLKLFNTTLILNILDAIITYIGLKFFTTIVEKNTWILGQIEYLGLGTVMVLKTVMITLLLLFLKNKFPLDDKRKLGKIFVFCVYVPIVLILIYAVVLNTIIIYNNLHSFIPMI